MMRTTPSCPSSTGIAATFPRPVVHETGKAAARSVRERLGDARRGGGERVRARRPQARDPRRQRGDLVRRHAATRAAGANAVASSHATTADARRDADDAKRDFDADASTARPASARSADSSASGAEPITRRGGRCSSVAARAISSRCVAPAKTIGAALSIARELTEQRQPGLAAVLPLPVRRIGDDDRRRARRGRDRAGAGHARAESLDRPRLLDVERLALRDALVGVDQAHLADPVARRELVRDRIRRAVRAR